MAPMKIYIFKLIRKSSIHYVHLSMIIFLLINSMRINFVLLATLSLFVLGNTYQRRMFTFRRHAQTFEFKTLCFNNSTFKWTTHPRLKKDSNRRILILILLPNK